MDLRDIDIEGDPRVAPSKEAWRETREYMPASHLALGLVLLIGMFAFMMLASRLHLFIK